MHELTIAAALVDQVCDHAAKAGAVRVAEISIRCGTLCEGAVLRIEEVPLTVMCTHCNAVKKPASRYTFRCPDCGRPTPKVLTGREMQLVSIGLVTPQNGTVGASMASPGPRP
jgi:hydrogenase nickel incorporation protein HypA/HybF